LTKYKKPVFYQEEEPTQRIALRVTTPDMEPVSEKDPPHKGRTVYWRNPKWQTQNDALAEWKVNRQAIIPYEGPCRVELVITEERTIQTELLLEVPYDNA
jgi:hypothetical protein